MNQFQVIITFTTNSPEHGKAIVTIKRVRDIVYISGMEGEETETKL